MTDKKFDKDAAEQEEQSAKRRRRVRALIIGSLAAGGAFQLNGWQAQAHGNRSTKSAVGEFQDVVRTPGVKAMVAKHHHRHHHVEKKKPTTDVTKPKP